MHWFRQGLLRVAGKSLANVRGVNVVIELPEKRELFEFGVTRWAPGNQNKWSTAKY